MSELSLVHTVRPPSSSADLDERPPLLILLHGVGSNEQSMAQLAPAFDPRFIVVSARSPIVLGANSFGWFHVTFGADGPVIVAEEAEAGWQHVARFIDEAVAAYGADPDRVFLAGFSQGGIMALATMLTSPAKVAGAVSMSGRLLPEVLPHAASAESLRGKPVLVVHGALDEKLGIHLARWAREQLAPFGLDLTYRELSMGHTVSAESLGIVTSWLAEALNATTSRSAR